WLSGDLTSLPPPAEDSRGSEHPRRNSRERGARDGAGRDRAPREDGDKDRGRGRGNRAAASHKADNDIQDNGVDVIEA
ncbi:ATP-dependent helicase, partial [Rhizobium leguminosarum]